MNDHDDVPRKGHGFKRVPASDESIERQLRAVREFAAKQDLPPVTFEDARARSEAEYAEVVSRLREDRLRKDPLFAARSRGLYPRRRGAKE